MVLCKFQIFNLRFFMTHYLKGAVSKLTVIKWRKALVSSSKNYTSEVKRLFKETVAPD